MNMKRNIFLAGAFAALIVSYLLVLRLETGSRGDPTRFIPATALLYLEQRDGITALRELAASPLGQRFAAIDFVSTGAKIGMAPDQAELLAALPRMVARIVDEPLFHALLGRRFTLALLSPLHPEERSITDFLRENTVLVCDPEQPAALLEFLGEGYARFDARLTMTTSQYGRHRIQRLQRGEESLSLAVIDGAILVAVNERQLRRCIDAFDGDIAALGGEEVHRLLKENFVKADRFIYLP
jgi:hypothetical protein